MNGMAFSIHTVVPKKRVSPWKKDMVFHVPDHMTWKNLETGIVLLDLRNSNYFTLNETAALVWRGIMDEKNRDKIVAQLVEEYDCNAEQAALDVRELVSFMLDEGLIFEES